MELKYFFIYAPIYFDAFIVLSTFTLAFFVLLYMVGFGRRYIYNVLHRLFDIIFLGTLIYFGFSFLALILGGYIHA